MNFRETCILHSPLKSGQVFVLEKLADNFPLLSKFLSKTRIMIPAGKRKESLIVIDEKQDVSIIPNEKMLDYEGVGIALSEWNIYPIYTNDGEIIAYFEYEEYDRQIGSLAENPELDFQEEELCSVNYLVPDGMVLFQTSKRIAYINTVAKTILNKLGVKTKNMEHLVEALGISIDKLGPSLNGEGIIGQYNQLKEYFVLLLSVPVYNQGKLWGTVLFITDITMIKNKERELIKKSTVIKEIHHRVKNNLQTIISLLMMQKRRSNSQLVEKVLNESVNRIQSIAFIHEALSKQELETINFKQTTYSILEMILSNMVDPQKNIYGEISGEDLFLSAKVASSLSLCINELVQNAIEHAFVQRKKGKIIIKMQRNKEQVCISVKDDGIGAPDFIKNGSSLGIKIVKIITEQTLKGKFTVESNATGTVAKICFPDSILHEED